MTFFIVSLIGKNALNIWIAIMNGTEGFFYQDVNFAGPLDIDTSYDW